MTLSSPLPSLRAVCEPDLSTCVTRLCFLLAQVQEDRILTYLKKMEITKGLVRHKK